MSENNLQLTPKVTVTVVTYNHGKWLGACLESIITQNTTFPFEIIVGDDASTDKYTIQILKDYSSRYPNVIFPVFRDINIGPTANYLDVVNRANGDYIAHIDGDDIMLQGKLQRQVEILDAFPNVTIVAHEMLDASDESNNPGNRNKTTGLETRNRLLSRESLLYHGCFFCHSSKMYRKSSIITRHSDSQIVDFYFHIEHAKNGMICFIPETLGGHRIHPNGISQNPKSKQWIKNSYQDAYDRAIQLGYEKKIVERGRIQHQQATALSSLYIGDLDSFILYAKLSYQQIRYATLKQRIISLLTKFPRLSRKILLFKNL